MRALLYAVLLQAWALLAAGCLCPPTNEAWLAVGFRTPEQTFRTFQTGLRAKDPDLEYRCLGNDFKRREGVSQLVYREFRRELFRTRPWLKLAARAEVKRVEELADGRARLVAEVDTWFHDETFAIELVREDFYELYVDGKRAADDGVRWKDLVRAHGEELAITVPLPAGLEPLSIGEVRVGREWKIDGFPGAALAP
jgi:hypothetical protein